MIDELREGQGLWSHERYLDEKPANGIIVSVFWEDEEVLVQYTDEACEYVSFSDLEGTWTDRFGGLYLVICYGSPLPKELPYLTA